MATQHLVNDTLFVNSSNNRVGIGTTSPGLTFEVDTNGTDGNIRMRYNGNFYTDYWTNRIIYRGDTNGQEFQLRESVNGTEYSRLFIKKFEW